MSGELKTFMTKLANVHLDLPMHEKFLCYGIQKVFVEISSGGPECKRSFAIDVDIFSGAEYA